MLPEPPTARTDTSIEDVVDRYTARLHRDGWCIVPDAMPVGTVGALDRDLEEDFEHTPFCDGGFYGRRTKRFGRLLARSPLAAAFVQHRTILGVAERILSPWCDCLQLNLTQAIALPIPARCPSFHTGITTCGEARSAGPNIWST